MKRIEFDSHSDFICEVDETFQALKQFDEYGSVSIVAMYDDVIKFIKEFLYLDYEVASLHLGKEDSKDYYKEYVLSISSIDGEQNIWCEAICCDGEYLDVESDVVYLMDNCSSVCIPHIKGKFKVEVGIDNECGCSEHTCKDTNDSESTYISRDKDGNPLGFSKTWSTVKDGVHCHSSYSHYSSDVDVLRSIASDFGVRL